MAVGLFAILIVFVAIKSVAEIKSVSFIGKSTAVPSVISVSGKGEVVASPDIATFTFSVSEEASVVKDAQTKTTDKMNSILAYIKKSGIDDKDVKTISYDIYPRYDYQSATTYSPGKQVLSAYVVTHSVQVKVRALEDAGKILSGIGEFGANYVSGLSFTVDDQDAKVREARDKAIVDAREQADKLAKALGVKIVGITSFYDSTPYQPYPMYAKDMGMGGREGVANQSMSLPTGENKITSNVTITYEIK
jgi:uncharacterized protein